MIFRKKFIFFIAGSGIFATIAQAAANKLSWYDDRLSSSQEEQMFELMKNVADVHTDGNLDPNVAQLGKTRFLYSLFSTNLATFSESFKTQFYKWALYQWAEWMLYKTPKASFPDVKKKIYDIVSKIEYKHNQGANGTPFDVEHWTKKNTLISDSHASLGNVFTDFFFKDIWKNTENTDISKTDDELKSYGYLDYAKSMVDFQKFVFDEWMSMQKPVLLCKKSWGFSSKISDNLYSGEDIPTTPNFNFPDFKEKKDEIVNFNSSGSCDEKIVFTSDDLTKSDGREIDAFIFKYFSEVDTTTDTTVSSSLQGDQYESLNTGTDIYKIFVQDSRPSDSNITQPNSNLIDDKGDLKDDKSKHFLSWRKVKFGNDNKFGTYVRTDKGITFLYIDSNEKDSKKEILKNPQKYDLSNKLKTFFVSKAGELIGKYLSKEGLPLPAGIFGDRNWSTQTYDLVKNFSLFSLELSKNKSHWDTMVQLSSAVKGYENASFESSKPDKSSGLGLPLCMKRNLDSTTSLTSSESNSSFLSSLNGQNNGLFPLLQKYYDSQWKAENINTYAQNLRKSILDYLKTIPKPVVVTKTKGSSHARSGYFLGDYMMDNVYRYFLTKDSGQFAKRAAVSLTLANRMKFNFFNNDISAFVNGLLEGSKISTGSSTNKNALGQLFSDSISNLYYGKQYLEEPIEKRINYGGFKFEKPEKSCLRTISSSSGAGADKAGSNDNCDKSASNQKEWNQKMIDYWLAKNYVFGSDGYELGSEQTNNYIKYLHSLYHMSLDGFKNMREFVTGNMPVGKHGALIWMDNVSITSENNSENLAKKGSDGEINDFNKYFRSSEMEKIFNPFFNRSIEVKDTNKSNLSAGHMGAYALNGEGKYVELFGFKGLYTERLVDNDIPKQVVEAVFKKFKDANPTDNKNYLSSAGSSGSSGISFGELMNSPNFELDKRINEFSTSTALKQFLSPMLGSLVDEVWGEVETSGLNLSQIKEKVKEKIKGDKYANQIKASYTRFSGLLQNPGREESTRSNNQFFIPTDTNESSGKVVYVTQVNAYDFRGGFSDFVKTIGTDAFVKMVVRLSSQNKAMEQSTNFYLSARGMII